METIAGLFSLHTFNTKSYKAMHYRECIKCDISREFVKQCFNPNFFIKSLKSQWYLRNTCCYKSGTLLDFLKKKGKSFFEQYEVIILVGAWSNPRPKGFMVDLTTLRPTVSPHNIQRIEDTNKHENINICDFHFF